MSLLPKRIFFIFDFTMLIKAERAAGSTWADSAFTFGSRAIDGRDGPGPSDIAKDSSSSQEARASSSELLRVRASYISKWHRSGLESESWSLASGFVSSCSSSSSLNRNGERPSLHQSDANGTKYSLWKSSWKHSSWERHGGKTKNLWEEQYPHKPCCMQLRDQRPCNGYTCPKHFGHRNKQSFTDSP